MPDFKLATVISHQILTAKVHDFVLETAEPLTYQPGQYISIQVAPKRLNAYSIAGKLGGYKIGLLVDTTPGGPGSIYFENLKAGDLIKFLGPFGNFTLRPDDGSDHVLILGTGCGISPLKAIIEGALQEAKLDKPITLYFGLRYPTDIFWDKYFNQLQVQYPNFKFKLCLSKPDQSWQGVSGHITDLVKQEHPQAQNYSAYICGNNKMSQEAIEILKQAGCPPEKIYHEVFG